MLGLIKVIYLNLNIITNKYDMINNIEVQYYGVKISLVDDSWQTTSPK